MTIVKKIDLYVVRQFLLLFFATFFISSFILLMQFMWKHVNDIVGKGLDWDVLFEFFFYSALTVVPLALPLAILLASLMTFGNLGEKMELTAMKASGISLFRIMAPLTVLIATVCVAAFFFSNNVLPVSQKKLWTLIFSLRQTSPELEIPTGEFYSGIKGYNLYVRNKDTNRKLLENVMIYDFSNGFANASVTTADSARMQMAKDKTYLEVTLYNGEAFENLRSANNQELDNVKSLPYRRETFKQKKFVIDFNSNFARMDEDIMKDDYMSKNLSMLAATIDSVNASLKAQQEKYAEIFRKTHFLDRRFTSDRYIKDAPIVDYQHYIRELPEFKQKQLRSWAYINAKFLHDEVSNQKTLIEAQEYIIIRHGIEMHRKFTLSFACLIFFFIGAPLGAIIRKGGLGVPVVISVALFIIYYLIDNTGFKLAREDVWPVSAGIWLSSFCLLPVGILFTYKAAKDSPLFNSDAYRLAFIKIKNKITRKNKNTTVS